MAPHAEARSVPGSEVLRARAERLAGVAERLDAHGRRLAAATATLAAAFARVTAGARDQAARATDAVDAAQTLLHEAEVAADDLRRADADAIAAGAAAASDAARAALARVLAPGAGPEAAAEVAALLAEALDHLGDVAQASRATRQALGDLAAGSETQRMGAQTIVRCVDELALFSARTGAGAAQAREPLRDLAALPASLAGLARVLAVEAQGLAAAVGADARISVGRAGP